jgi:hypothetical protein
MLAATSCWATVGSQAATLNVDGSGQLTGATNVDVGGSLYNVTFVAGNCIANFSGCDSASDFAFNSKSAADAAAQALLDQVFIGAFDSAPENTFGCGSPAPAGGCSALVPYGFGLLPESVIATAAFNWANPDFIFDAEVFRSNVYGGDGPEDTIVYAQFTAVPLHPSIVAQIAGLGLLVLLAWRKKRKTATAVA